MHDRNLITQARRLARHDIPMPVDLSAHLDRRGYSAFADDYLEA